MQTTGKMVPVRGGGQKQTEMGHFPEILSCSLLVYFFESQNHLFTIMHIQLVVLGCHHTT